MLRNVIQSMQILSELVYTIWDLSCSPFWANIKCSQKYLDWCCVVVTQNFCFLRLPSVLSPVITMLWWHFNRYSLLLSKTALQHKGLTSEWSWLRYIWMSLSAKGICIVFIERKMAFDTWVHNEFKETKIDYGSKDRLFLELWRLLKLSYNWTTVWLLLKTQSSSSAGVNCQKIHWFQRNYDNLWELQISL